jgi:hypothetical protein
MFLTGVAISVMNPKGILLFFSYFPQFVAPEAGNGPLDMMQGCARKQPVEVSHVQSFGHHWRAK